MALTPLNESLGRTRAAHLLRRTVFGATQEEVATFAALTPAEALALLFKENIESPLPPIDPNTGSEWMLSGTSEANNEDSVLESYFLRWHLGQMVGGTVTGENKLTHIFKEKLVLFLHTHFTTKRSTVGSSRALYFQNELFRKFAFDSFLPEDLNFKSLVIKLCVDNAMLKFLDGRLNVKGNPNENFARELLELYSVGRGLEGSDKNSESEGDYGTFTEHDVQQGAKILSGFDLDPTFSVIDPDTGLPTGRIRGNGNIATQHDNNTKELSIRFNNAVIAPDPELLVGGEPTRESALNEIQQFVDAIFNSEETAKHICRKLYRFFGYHEITEETQNGIISDMAQIFIASDYKIQPVLEAYFSSREFYEGGAGVEDDFYGSIIKSPIDLVIGHARTFELSLPNYLTNATEFYDASDFILKGIKSMGLDYYEPFEVAGYSAYHQFPIYYRGWITTNHLTQRYSYVQKVSEGMMGDIPVSLLAPLNYVENNVPFATASNAKSLVEEVCKQLLAVSSNVAFGNAASELTEERLSYFLNAFLLTFNIDENPEEAWTFRWSNGVDPETVRRQLQDLFNAILQSPEYQLM